MNIIVDYNKMDGCRPASDGGRLTLKIHLDCKTNVPIIKLRLFLIFRFIQFNEFDFFE